MATIKKRGVAAAAEVRQSDPQFDKEQIIVSERYRNERDLVDALLEDGKKYTTGTVDSMIEKYKKGKVN